MRLRTVVTGVLLAVLVGPVGQPVARAATPTPTQIQTLVNDAVTASRAEASAGVSFTTEDGTAPSPFVQWYDLTSGRSKWRTAQGWIRIETADAIYDNRRNPKAFDAKVKKLAGRPAGVWIRIPVTDPRHVEDFNGVEYTLDFTFLSLRADSSVPATGSVTSGPAGSTVYSLSWSSGVTTTWTISADGLVVSWLTRYGQGSTSVSFTYAPQTITLPTRVMGTRLYERADESLRLPATVKAGAKQVRRFANDQPPATVKEIRKWARKWRNNHNTYDLLVAHVTNVRGGAKIWVKNPFTGTVVSRRVVTVGGKAVVRR